MKVSTRKAYELFHDGTLAFSRMEENGMRIDVGYLDSTIQKISRDIESLEHQLKSSKFFRRWEKECREQKKRPNLGSRPQLAHMLFNVMKYSSTKETKEGKKPSTDAESLEKINSSFVRKYLKTEKLKKAKSTFLMGIKKELEGDLIHPFFNLHSVVSFRSSANSPNTLNFPKRDKFFAELVRKCFIPRKDHVLVEIDLKANEVRVACCYSKDKNLINDTLNGDMHRDMAAECFLLPKGKVNKDIRHVAKNSFVFAEFYGDYWGQVAPSMWEAIKRDDLKTKKGISLYKHLKKKGIKELGTYDSDGDPEPGTFAYHIKKVENRFWNERYYGYRDWKDEWWEKYLSRGWFKMHTGFVVRWGRGGLCDKKKAECYPIQGSAFHCLLWALIEVIKWLKKKKMRSLIIGQIYDSIIADVHKNELQDFLQKIKELLVYDIRKAWPWLIVPLGIEAEISDTNWFEKKEIEI